MDDDLDLEHQAEMDEFDRSYRPGEEALSNLVNKVKDPYTRKREAMVSPQ